MPSTLKLGAYGYTVELIGNHSSMNDIPDEVSNTFDWYDYYPEEV